MVRNDKNWWNGTKEVRKDLANKVKDYNASKKDLKNVLSGKKTDMTLDQAKGNVKGKYKDVQSAKGKLDGKIKEGEQLKKDHSKELKQLDSKGLDCQVRKYGDFYVAPKKLKAFLNAKLSPRKTSVQGGGGKRVRWKEPDGKTYEWDSQNGTVEKYNKRGEHLGEFNPLSGVQTKPSDPTRKVMP